MKYMDEVAPFLQPAAVDVSVEGKSEAFPCTASLIWSMRRDSHSLKTRSRRPPAIPAADVFQVTTYRQLLPAAADFVCIDNLIKTKSVQIVRQSRHLTPKDFQATTILYPLARQAMHTGIYMPNRLSLYCSRRHCAFWRQCEHEFGGHVPEA